LGSNSAVDFRIACLLIDTMKTVVGRIAFLLALHAWESSAVTPVQKVIQLLEGMSATGKKEKHDEQVQFAAYKQFCDDTTVEKKRAIEEANEKN